MKESDNDNVGYVYILEVKDIDLPVCKIGRTTRNPYERCDEINQSSTGDFIWSVAYCVAVDDCKKLESLVHSKLAPLRQKGREFFNISADAAYKALNSILEKQTDINKVYIEETRKSNPQVRSKNKVTKSGYAFRKIDTEYAELLKLFTSMLNVKGRSFGQLNKPVFGICDGNEGVQWNLAISTDTGMISLGVNLEGKKYNDWPISKFILSELNDPKILMIAKQVKHPDNIFVSFFRDAWQVTSRPDIVEKHIGGKEFALAEMNVRQWLNILKEALGCLDEERNYRGRAKQTVTLAKQPSKGERVRVMEVSPHLRIWSSLSLGGDVKAKLENKIAELQPVYDWVKEISEA